MFKLNWINIKSALVYGLLSALLAICVYAVGIGDVFKMDWKALVNAGFFAFLMALVSLLKNLLTTDSGKFMGLTQVITPIESSEE